MSKSKLTLSAVPSLGRDAHERSTVVVEDHGLPLIQVGPVPSEASVRDERDPYIDPELELRYAWGDR